jgi:hypothetical protein
MKNLNELKQQFFINNFPLWKLYRGTRKTASEQISSNLKEFRMEESWAKLETVLNLNKSSIFNFTIYQTDNEKNTTGGYTLFLDIKETPAPSPASPPSLGAIQNTQLLQITQDFNNTIQELKEQIKEQQHKTEKQEIINEFNLKIQELENSTNTKKEGLEMLKLFALNFIKPGIGLAGIETAQTATVAEMEAETENIKNLDFNIDFNSVLESVAIIKTHIKDVEVLLFKLSETLENSTETERQNLINVLKMYLT